MDFDPQLSMKMEKFCWDQSREGVAPVGKRVAQPLRALIKTFQYLARGGGIRKHIPTLPGGQGHTEQGISPTKPHPSPSSRWIPEQKTLEKTENTAGNGKGTQKSGVVSFFLYKTYIKNTKPLR